MDRILSFYLFVEAVVAPVTDGARLPQTMFSSLLVAEPPAYTGATSQPLYAQVVNRWWRH